MAKLRLERVAEQIKHVISRVVTQEMKDPRCGFITIVNVKVAPDLKTARVNYSVLGTDAQKRTTERAVGSARGYIQSRVAEQTTLKYTPVITFHLDESVEREIDMVHQIDQVVETDRRAAAARTIRSRIAEGSIPPEFVESVDRAAASDAFLEPTADLLTRLLEINTTPGADFAATAAAERECLTVVERELAGLWADEVRIDFIDIDPDVGDDPGYVPPAYAAAPDREPAPAAEIYAGRANLLATLVRGDLGQPGAAEPDELLPPRRLLLHTHIDTRPPHEPPSRDGDLIRGAGAADAKAQTAMMAGAFRLLKHLRDEHGVRACEDLGAAFVVDGTAGGNGTLCLGLQDPFLCDGIVVCAPTALAVRPASGAPDGSLAVYAAESLRRIHPDAGPPEPRAAEGDAAVLADLFPSRPIILFGPGDPAAEGVCLRDIAAGAKMLAFMVLESAGFLL